MGKLQSICLGVSGAFLVAFDCASIPWNLDRLDQHGPHQNGVFIPQGNFVKSDGGANVNVYVIGSGIDHNNKAQFDNRVADGYNFVGDYPFAADCNGQGTHVAGAAALYLSRHPQAAPAEVYNAIMENVDRGIVKNAAGSANNMIYMGPLTVQMSCNSYGSSAGCAVNRVQGAADWYTYHWTWGGNGQLDANGPVANITACTTGGHATVAVTDALGYTRSASQYVSCSGGGGPLLDMCPNGNCW